MSLLTRDYDFALPDELIARKPLERRDESRMLVLHRGEQRIEHRHFRDFPSYLEAGDLVVLNDTKVIPARVFANGGKIELLFLDQAGPVTWKCMVRPGRKMRVGDVARVGENRGTVTAILPGGERMIAFEQPVDFAAVGEVPLPPYLERTPDAEDLHRYQTVYAKEPGAVAAPTAGLHFTPEILAPLPHAFLTLHVGAGTFKPVQTERITDHEMHTERFSISASTATALNACTRVVAIGTTTARVLEHCAVGADAFTAREGETNIFIHPPYEFRAVDVLLTNFHLPGSTLLMLVSAFAGREWVLRAYVEAIRERYRFYSYGDCMLII